MTKKEEEQLLRNFHDKIRELGLALVLVTETKINSFFVLCLGLGLRSRTAWDASNLQSTVYC